MRTHVTYLFERNSTLHSCGERNVDWQKKIGGFKETVEFEEVSGPFLQEWEIKAHHRLTKPLIQANMALPYVTARWPNVAVRLQNVAAWLRSVCFLPIARLIIPSSKFLTKTLCFVI